MQPDAHVWGLEARLDKFTVDFLQHHLERGAHGRATLAMLDFAFPPQAPLAATVQAIQHAHIQHKLGGSTTGPGTGMGGGGGGAGAAGGMSGPIGAAGASGHAAAPSARLLGGGGGATPEVTPGLHYFPELPEGRARREQDLADLTLSMQDISTNLVVVLGAPGSGRSALAAALAEELVGAGHWAEAYWADLAGVSGVATAGMQLLGALGLLTDAPDPSQLLAWLESRSGERFGIVVAHTGQIMSGPADDQAALLELVDRMLAACPKLQIVLVSDDHLQRAAYNARTLELQPLPRAAASAALRAAAPDAAPAALERLADACGGNALALEVVAGLLQHGYAAPGDLERLLSDPGLPGGGGGGGSGAGTPAGSMRRDSSAAAPPDSERERLMRLLVGALIALPDDLGNAILVLSLVPAPFMYDTAARLLAHPASDVQRRGLLRRLVALGLLTWTPGRRSYAVPGPVRDAAAALAASLGMDYAESRAAYLRHLAAGAAAGPVALYDAGFKLAAFVAWQPFQVHVAQAVSGALGAGVREEELPALAALLWDALPLMARSTGAGVLQGFCQKLLDKATLLDRRVDAARVGTQFGALLCDAGAVRRAEPLLRNALELLWRELRAPHPYIARCYAVLGAVLAKAGKLQDAGTQLQQAADILQSIASAPPPPATPRSGAADGDASVAAGAAAAGATADAERANSGSGPAAPARTATAGAGGLLPAAAAARLLPVLLSLADVRRRQRRFADAEALCRRALGVAGMAYAPSHPEVAAVKGALAQVFRASGALPEAEALHREALAGLEAALGPEHPKVAAALAALGGIAQQRGNVSAAEALFRKALQVCQATQGLNHPETGACLAQLVALLRGANKAANALPLAQRCLSIKRQLLGEGHSEVALAMQAVADVMLDLGRYGEVEKLCGRAAAILQAGGVGAGGSAGGASAPRRPGTPGAAAAAAALRPLVVAQTTQALALVLMGRPAEAEALARACLELAEARMPAEGPLAAERNRLVASASNCLSEALRELGRLEDAEAACRRGLELREAEFGPAHPAVALSLQSLALVLRARQQLPAAGEAAARCLDIRAGHKSTADGPQVAAALNLKVRAPLLPLPLARSSRRLPLAGLLSLELLAQTR